MQLDPHDLRFALLRLPANLIKLMKEPEWKNRIYIGGGYLRCVVSGDPVNDIDVFVRSKADAELLSLKLAHDKKDVIRTDNAYTVKGKKVIQVIHRWVFDKPEDVSNSFDFTVCCAVIFYDEKWGSFCDDRFYIDIASKRLVYRSPVRNEDAGGSMLRVLKYYQKGYRMPLDSLGAVIARLTMAVDFNESRSEEHRAKVITGLLREVDPNVDPTHLSHLPSLTDDEDGETIEPIS